jgi:hypothetical protein
MANLIAQLRNGYVDSNLANARQDAANLRDSEISAEAIDAVAIQKRIQNYQQENKSWALELKFPETGESYIIYDINYPDAYFILGQSVQEISVKPKTYLIGLDRSSLVREIEKIFSKQAAKRQ